MVKVERYGTVAILLHWTIALLILIAFALGLTVDDFPETWTRSIVNLHVLLGLSVLALSLFRLGWRLTHKPPRLPVTLSPLTIGAAGIVQFLLYALMILVPLIGIPTLLFRGVGLDLAFSSLLRLMPGHRLYSAL
jgi:cytochrome b561